MLNRAVLIVRPKQPYIDWAAGLDDSGLVPEFEGEETAYLIPSFEDDDEAEDILNQVYSEIFERELEGWHTDENDWPRNRTFAMFKQWFHLELHSVVEDLCAYELIEEDDSDTRQCKFWFLARLVGGSLSTSSAGARGENIVEAAFLSRGEMNGRTVFPPVVVGEFWTHLRDGFAQPRYLGVREAVIKYAG